MAVETIKRFARRTMGSDRGTLLRDGVLMSRHVGYLYGSPKPGERRPAVAA